MCCRLYFHLVHYYLTFRQLTALEFFSPLSFLSHYAFLCWGGGERGGGVGSALCAADQHTLGMR